MQLELTFEQFLERLALFTGGHADLNHPLTREQVKGGIDLVFVEDGLLKVRTWWTQTNVRGIYQRVNDPPPPLFILGTLGELRARFEDQWKGRFSFGNGVVLYRGIPGKRAGPEICQI